VEIEFPTFFLGYCWISGRKFMPQIFYFSIPFAKNIFIAVIQEDGIIAPINSNHGFPRQEFMSKLTSIVI